jgi:nicotinamidase/pyrazinamidase
MHGAEVPAQLRLPPDLHLVLKERRPADRSYSGFQATGLAVELRETGCRRVFIGGLGTEYGIRATALDAFAAGFETIVLEDAIRPLEVQPGDGARALGELRARGVRIEPVDSLTPSTVSA